jgi:hypothetical protein
MPKQRNYSTEFEPGCSGISGRRDLHGLAKRHDVSRNVTRLWVARYEFGKTNVALSRLSFSFSFSFV